MRPYKATAGPPFDRKPAWYGLYWIGGRWREVRNDNDLPIIYTAAQHAINAAKYVRTQELCKQRQAFDPVTGKPADPC